MRNTARIVRFGAVSLLSTVVDNVAFFFIYRSTHHLAESQVGARCVSVLFNYLLVRASVFHSLESHTLLLPRYLGLIAVNAALAYLGIRALTAFTPMGVIPAKMLAETLLFLVNYTLQRVLVFDRPRRV